MMLLEIKSNSRQVRAELERLNGELLRELRVANERIGAQVHASSKRLLQSEVYNIPIPRSAGGKQKWRRGGDLKRSESFRLSANGLMVILTNNSQHALPRHALGGPNPPNRAGRQSGEQQPQAGAPAAQRSRTKHVGHWQERAAQQNEAFIAREYRAALERALGRSG